MGIVSGQREAAGTKRLLSVCRSKGPRFVWAGNRMKPLRPSSRGGPCTHLYSRPIFICIYSPSSAFPAIYSDEKGPDGNRFQHAACCRCHDPKRREVLDRRWQVERETWLDWLYLPGCCLLPFFFPGCFSFTNADAFYIRLKACWESGVGGVEVSNLTLVPR